MPDDAAIRDAAMTEEAEEAQEPVTDEELSIASKLIPGLVEVGNQDNRSLSSSASMNLLGLELEVLRLRTLALSMTSSESEN